MTGLVLSNNYVLTYVFWEGVGACSYLLVGYWHTRPSAAAAAMKAFLVNRVGDFGFAVAIFWLWSVSPGHDLSYDGVFPRAVGRDAARVDPGRGVVALLGCDREECPDPALRLATGRDGRPDARLGADPRGDDGHRGRLPHRPIDPDRPWRRGCSSTIAVIGCATALLAAAIALTQNDLKRVMAYSTVSQLGYMFMGLGAGVGKWRSSR